MIPLKVLFEYIVRRLIQSRALLALIHAVFHSCITFVTDPWQGKLANKLLYFSNRALER